MPRVLPWHRAQNEAPVKAEATPRKRVKTEPRPDRNITPKISPVSPTRRDFFRSSQSPPTSPIRECPPEDFLITGLEHDDGWVMVEDEFYAVAQTYTQHLHYAEYHRRRKEVKAKNATILGDIERPTDNRTPLPKDVERKREQENLRQRQKAALANVEDAKANENDDDDLWAGTHLHGLMTSPRKTRSLASLHTLKSSTRAAAGFRQATTSGTARSRVNSIGSVTNATKGPESETIKIDEETASDSDDDLDQQPQSAMLPPPKRTQSVPHHHQADAQTTPGAHRESNIQINSTSKKKRKPPNGRPSPAPGFKSRVQSLFDDLDELPESSRINNSISNARAPSSSQPPEKGKRNNFNPKKSQHNEVPTFLV